jgi:hypothetical protein
MVKTLFLYFHLVFCILILCLLLLLCYLMFEHFRQCYKTYKISNDSLLTRIKITVHPWLQNNDKPFNHNKIMN